MKIKKRSIILLPILLIVVLLGSKRVSTYLFGEARWKRDILPDSNLEIPALRTIPWNDTSTLAYQLLLPDAKEKQSGQWSQQKKAGSPRTILRQLMAGRNIPEINAQILRMQPWGTSGSKWLLNPNGGYNFALPPFTTILYLFDNHPEILYPETKKHLAEVLLINEGGGFTDAVPNTLGRIKDSENHVLMSQSSTYLKNRYMMLHGNRETCYNNETNGMEVGMLNHLAALAETGLYEFNSMPYSAYTIMPLLNLEAFGSEKVREAAREVLDYLSYAYALGSYKLRYYPPFRRRYNREGITTLSTDYQTVFMKTWLSFHPSIRYSQPIKNGKNHALMAFCLPYRPPDEAVKLIINKSPGYFVKLGHGTKSCPEIYSAGHGYLLSAGGANQGKWSIIVARPICLFLDDAAHDLADVIHLKGSNPDFMQWNNTGVYKDFACANGPVYIPGNFHPVAKKGHWSVYAPNDTLAVAVHSSKNIGIISIFNNKNPKKLAEILLKHNPDPEILKTQFQFPGGSKIVYDVNAPRNRWVIKAVNGKPMNRKFDKWPLINGDKK